MSKKVYLGLVCLMAFVFAFLVCQNTKPVYAYEATKEWEFLWEQNEDGTYTITGVENSNYVTKIVIPEQIYGGTVTAIGDNAFNSYPVLEYVEIPDSVTKIGTNALAYCTALKELHLSKYITEFGNYANSQAVTSLYMTKSLTKITVEEENPLFSSKDGALYTKDGKTLLWVPDAVGPEYVIDEETETIARNAFWNCHKLEKIVFSEKPITLTPETFSGCYALKEYSVPEENPFFFSRDGLLYAKYESSKTLLSVPAARAEGYFEIPEGTVYIDNDAFDSCVKLERVYIPASVKIKNNYFHEGEKESVYLGCNYFYNCSLLTEIHVDPNNKDFVSEDGILYTKDKKTLIAVPPYYKAENLIIPEGVEDIGWCAFRACGYIRQVEFPQSIRRISWHAFQDCNKLNKIVISGDLSVIESFAFMDCQALVSVQLPETLTEMRQGAFQGCTKLVDVDAGQFTKLVKEAISTGEELLLTPVELPIEPEALVLQETATKEQKGSLFTYYVTNGNEVVITGLSLSVKEKRNIRVLEIPVTLGDKKVTAIATAAFCNTGITSLSLPEGLKEIGEGAFYGCNLSDVSIPSTVYYIGTRAFGANYRLKEIKVAAGNPQYTSVNGVLYNKNKTILVFIPANYQAESYEVLAGVQIIGDYAFGNNRRIENLTLPASLVIIREKAFWNMASLLSLSIPETVSSVAEDAWENCLKLKSVDFQ